VTVIHIVENDMTANGRDQSLKTGLVISIPSGGISFSQRKSKMLNDFGFTAIDEDELSAVQEVKSTLTEVSSTAETTQDRLDKLYNAITPLLNNLKANPEREYILWPNRLEKVEQFEDHLQAIYRGE